MSLDTEVEKYKDALNTLKRAQDALRLSESSITSFFGSVVEELNRTQDVIFEKKHYGLRYINRDHKVYLVLHGGQLRPDEIVENPQIDLYAGSFHTLVSTYRSGDVRAIAHNIARDLGLAKKVVEDELTRQEELREYRKLLGLKPDLSN